METHFEIMERTLREEARGKLFTNLKTLATDAEELMNATAGEVSEKAKEARDRLATALQRAKVTCWEFEKRAAAGAKAADKAIRAKPYHSVGIAFGVGLFIGVLAVRN